MRARTVILASVAAVVLAGGSAAVGAAVFGGDESPSAATTASPVTSTKTETVTATPSPTPTATKSSATPTMGTPATSSPKVPTVPSGATVKEVFPGLIAPVPATWVGEGSDSDSHVYADVSSCTTAQKRCPQVEFLSLTSGPNLANYGSAPLRQWAKNVCPERSADSVASMGTFVTGGTTVKAYEFACQGIENYAWLVPDKLLVLTSDATGGASAPATVQAVLENARIG